MNLIKKKKTKSNINGLIDANKQIQQFLIGMQLKHNLNAHEVKDFKMTLEHLDNVTSVFNAMLVSLDRQK